MFVVRFLLYEMYVANEILLSIKSDQVFTATLTNPF